jgi:N-acetylglucosaminyldiphosphoundecaprenol N-acetyl-beta-D-mannosaminyltransferase
VQFAFGDQTVKVNVPTHVALFNEIKRRFAEQQGFALATVNLDHLVKLSEDEDFAQIYAAQDLIVADGRPIVTLSRMADRPVDLMPGSDLVRPLCTLAAESGVRVALVGSSDQALSDAKANLEADTPGLEIAYCCAPAYGFDPNGEIADEILQALNEADVQLCFLALGAPKQESLALRGRKLAPRVGFASVGAGLDFLGGHQVRAPLWVRKMALEWLWRACSSPGRMFPRYAKCALILPGQMMRALKLRNVAQD